MKANLRGNKKKLLIVFLSVFFFTMACTNEQKKVKNSLNEFIKKESSENIGKKDKRKFKNYTRPVLIDTAVFYFEGQRPEEKHYHINAYSELDTASIDFYMNWYDSIVQEFNGGRRSMVFFFNDSTGTPKISFPALVSKEYEEYCFLFIKFEQGALKHYWQPFR